MKLSFVLSNQAQIDPTIDLHALKELGSFWGGWKTWRSCQTDNVICNDFSKAKELINRDFHKNCNFFIPSSMHASLDSPQGVKLYAGEFLHDLNNQEDVVAMHLASADSDIVLLLGFDFSEPIALEDKLEQHRAVNYRNLTKQVIMDNKLVQWVVLDHPEQFRKDLLNIPNLDKDTLTNILNSGS
jgi:hypothetical protein